MVKENIYYTSLFGDATYYKNLPQDVIKNMKNAGINPLEISTLTGTQELPYGPFDSALKRILGLVNYSGNSIGNIFVKIYSPDVADLQNKLNPKQMGDKEGTQYRSPKYQYNQMEFWNRRLLPGPIVLAYNSGQILEKIKDERQKEKIQGYEILCDYWGGPSHDLDHLALNFHLKELDTDSLSPLIKNEKRDKIKQDIENLRKIKDYLIKSRLETINEVAVYGTYHLKEEDKNLYVFRPKGRIASNTERSKERSEYIILYNELMKGSMNIEQIKRYKDIPSEIRSNISKSAEALEKIIPILTSEMTDDETWVYMQGDENLHHFKCHKFNHNGSYILKAGIFDACKARMGNIAESKAKALLSPLIDISGKDIRKYLEYSLEHEKRLRAEFIKDRKINPKIAKREIDEEKEIADFYFIALYESLKFMARPPKYSVLDNDKYQIFIKNPPAGYKNDYLGIPKAPILYDIYKAENFLPASARIMREIIDITLNQKINDKKKYALESLLEILSDYWAPKEA